MEKTMECPQHSKENTLRIASFVLLDLETNNLPDHNFGKVSITELCMYGFLAKELQGKSMSSLLQNENVIPERPRTLQKLALVVNPRALINLSASDATGLNNYDLEEFPILNENTTMLVHNFIKQLPQPACLVAHNGFKFDFPIIKAAFDKFNTQFPEGVLCLDSLRTFYEIDNAVKEEEEEVVTDIDALQKDIDFRAINENTPKRKRTEIPPQSMQIRNEQTPGCSTPASSRTNGNCNARRALFKDEQTDPLKRMHEKFFPPKFVYKLGNVYSRIFGNQPDVVHYAEADVDSLMRLMLHYGKDFFDYAEIWAVPLSDIPSGNIICTN